MNYIIALLEGLILGFCLPKFIKRIKLNSLASTCIGGASGLTGYHLIGFAGIYPEGVPGAMLAAATGVALAFVNLHPYFTPRLPKVTVVARLFLGLFMLASGLMMWKVNPRPGESLPGMQPGPLNDWLQAVIDSGFLWQWIFIFKIVNGIVVLIPRACTIGILGAFAYYCNIMVFTLTIANLWLFLSIPAFIATIFLLYAYWGQYRHILMRE